MGVRAVIIIVTIAIGGALVYQDVNDRRASAEAAQERKLQLTREAEIARCKIKAADLRDLIGEKPGLDDHLATGQALLTRLKGWSEQSQTNMPPDPFDVLRDVEGQLRQYGNNATRRELQRGELTSLEAYITRLSEGGDVQLGMCQ